MSSPTLLLTHRRFLIFALTLAVGSIALVGCGREAPKAQAETAPETALEHAKKHLDPTYVCPMHPKVVSAEPGECPICGMDLVLKKVAAADRPAEAPTVTVSDAVVNQLGVRTAEVRRGSLTRHVQAFGSFVGSASRGYRPANRPSDPNLGDPAASPSVLVAQVFEREAPLVRQGQVARVRFPSLGAKEWTGTVSGVETQVSPLTRTLQFRVSVDLEGASVTGGMSALVTLEVDPVADVLLVPREAVILTGTGARVVVAQGEGRFQPREVEAEDLGEDEILIRSGLAEGERVVVSAQFLLDSEANLQAGLRRLGAERPEVEAMSEGAAQ
jgi:multidrug efflux pump subunit AcrA (membrane-fusion protein)